MGNLSSCPAGFEPGIFPTCHAQCPAGFKYMQGGPGGDTCIHQTRNKYSIALTTLPLPMEGQPVPPAYAAEKPRIDAEVLRINDKIRVEDAMWKELDDTKSSRAREYSKIQSEYAEFNAKTVDGRSVKEVADSLKPFRPPTAPATDLEAERKQILSIEARNLLFIQIALALVVLTLLSYMLLPAEYAHSLAFLLLCVAISVGFFLRR